MGFYNLSINSSKGSLIKMEDFKNKVILVVNTATQCGLAPQFDGLENLYQKYKDDGLVVIGFPCNQFKDQEPENDDNMVEACKINHGVSFTLTKKIDVNGNDTHEIFEYLKNELGGFLGNKIKWNFTKFLIDRNGSPYKRYAPIVKPHKIEKDIIRLLNQI